MLGRGSASSAISRFGRHGAEEYGCKIDDAHRKAALRIEPVDLVRQKALRVRARRAVRCNRDRGVVAAKRAGPHYKGHEAPARGAGRHDEDHLIDPSTTGRRPGVDHGGFPSGDEDMEINQVLEVLHHGLSITRRAPRVPVTQATTTCSSKRGVRRA